MNISVPVSLDLQAEFESFLENDKELSSTIVINKKTQGLFGGTSQNYQEETGSISSKTPSYQGSSSLINPLYEFYL
jgi:hypothetical protein